MGWGVGEYEAGVRRLEDEVRSAHAAVSGAYPGPELEHAREELRKAEESLEAGRALLRAAGGRSADGRSAEEHAHPPEPPRSSRSLAKSSIAPFLRSWSCARGELSEARHVDGLFLHVAGDRRTGIALEGTEDRWAMSVFAAARVQVRPTLELYRLISRWRTTRVAGAPYVVEDGEFAAVMCAASFHSGQLCDDTTARLLMTSTIDQVGDAALTIAADLADHDGVPFTGVGGAGAVYLSTWWKKSDERIASVIPPTGLPVAALHAPRAGR